jgi:hypothetical protein
MPVDAGTIYSEVRVQLARLDGDVRSVVANFDKIANASLKTTQDVAKSWDKVQASVGNIDKTYQGLKGTYDTVSQKQQALLAGIKDLIDKGVDPENARVQALKQQYNELQMQSDSAKAAHDAHQKKLEGLKAAYENITVAIGAAIAFSKKLVEAWAGAEQAAVRLDAAVKLSGGSLGESKALIEYGEELQKTSGFEHELTQNLMAQAEIMGRNKDETKALALAATQLANVGITSVDDAFTSLAITYDGMMPRSKVLKALIGDLSEEELRNGKAVDIVIEKTKGINEVMMNTSAGGLKNIKNAFGELTESAGRVVAILAGPAFRPFADVVNKLADLVNQTVELREAQIAYHNGTANLNQQLLVSKERYAAIIERLDELADKQNRGKKLSEDEQKEYLALQARMKEWGAAIKEVQDKLDSDEKAGARRKKQAADREKELAEAKKERDAKLQFLNEISGAEEQSGKDISDAQERARLKDLEDAKKERDAKLGFLNEMSGSEAQTQADIDDARKTEHDKELARQRELADIVTSTSRTMFEELGRDLVVGGDAWWGLARAAIGAISKIVSSLGDKLAALSAVELFTAIAKSFALDPSAVGNYAAAAEYGAGAAALYVTAGAIGAIDFETGGIVLPSKGGSLVRVAENGSSELLLNGGPQGQAMIEQFAGAIADKIAASQGGILHVQVNLDGQVLAEWYQKGSFDGRILTAQGSVVKT